jgi:hypothetical protein
MIAVFPVIQDGVVFEDRLSEVLKVGLLSGVMNIVSLSDHDVIIIPLHSL